MKKVNEEIKQKILERRIAGESATSLSKEYGVGKSTICKWYEFHKALNIDVSKSNFSKIKVNDDELFKFNVNGYLIEIEKMNLKDFLGALK